MTDQSTKAAPRDGGEARILARLSTGVKMLLILSLALLPLGLIAVFASQESAHVNRLRHEAEARASATAAAAVITDAITPGTNSFRQGMNDLGGSVTQYPVDRAQCRLRLEAVAERDGLVSGLAMFHGDGRPVCATRAYVSVPVYSPTDETGFDVRLAAASGLLLTTVPAGNGDYFGIAQFPTSAISKLLPSPDDHHSGVVLRQGSQSIILQQEQTRNPLDQIVSVTVPVAGGQYGLEMRMPAAPVGTVDVLLILLPILMWAAGGIIGWIVVDRLLLRPLGQMQRAIAVFSRAEGPLALPRLKTPAREIRALGESFQDATEKLKAHEEELAEGLANQKRLTREVHHRVKNNLQVVSSLISLHARGASDEAVAEAYASIQRRVDALAVVHRNHYAELEEYQGVSLRALIGEIASNLRASARGPINPTITLNIMSGSAIQDVAVPIAFLITEIVELVMLCGPQTNISITLAPVEGRPDRGLLSLMAESLAGPECRDNPTAERFDRIVGGLARQLRSPLDHQVEAGRYSIEIPILHA